MRGILLGNLSSTCGCHMANYRVLIFKGMRAKEDASGGGGVI